MATKADIDKWIATQGGPDAVSYGYEDVDVDNPAFNNPDHPNYQGRTQTPDKIKTRRETWTNKTTGATYSAVRTPYGNDEFQDLKETPGTKANPNTPEAKNAAELQRQREANVALPANQDPAYETDEDRRKRSDARIAQQGRDAATADAKARQERLDQEARDKANRPTVDIRDDGKGGLVAISTDPNTGKATTAPIPGVVGKPQTLTVGGVTYEKGPDGNYKPAAGIPLPGQTSKNVDPFTPDYSQPDLGLEAWAAKQRAKIGMPPEQGGITQDEYNNAATSAHASATTTIQNITSNQSVTRQQAIDEQTQKNKLSDEGASDFKTANDAFNTDLRYANPKTNAKFGTVPYLMEQMRQTREAAASTAKPMPPLHPMFTGLAQRAGVTPPPNAIGLGQGVVQPGQAPAPAVPPPTAGETGGPPLQPGPVLGGPTPTPAPVAPAPPLSEQPRDDWRTQGQDASTPPEASPPLMNQPPADASPIFQPGPHPYTPPATSGPLGPGLGPSSQTGMPDETHSWFRPEDQGWAPGISEFTPLPKGGEPTPVPGEAPGVNVPYPSDADPMSKIMPAGPISSWANTVMPQSQPAQADAQATAGPMNPALANLQQQAAQPQINPYAVAGRLVGLGFSSQALAQALREMGLDQPQQQGAAA